VRHRGCLIALAAVVALFAVAAAVVGPMLVRQGSRVVTPIRQMQAAQSELEKWERAHPWKDPATPSLGEARLATFLALRKEVVALDEQMLHRPQEQFPDGRQPSITDVPQVLEGVGDIVARRTAAFEKAGMHSAEYTYVEKLVYRTWLPALRAKGFDLAARDRAAREIEAAADAERDPGVAAGLRRVAASLRARVVPAPEGIPEDVHATLSARAAEIELLAASQLPAPSSRHGGIRVRTD
jgi:hypothetical protein